MAAYKPISGDAVQKIASNVAASGYYLKGYEAGTTTALAMGIDSTPTSTLAKAQVNSEGYLINGSSAVFIPHFNQDYKLVLYANETDADADTFGNAVYTIDNQTISNLADDINYDQGGTGSVERTVTSRLQERVSLLDFGIDNTGATDESAAIQAVIDQYDNVYAPPGTYKLSSTIYVYKTGMVLEGAGAGETTFSIDAGVEGIVVGNDATSAYTNHDIKVTRLKVTGGTYGVTVGGNGTGPKAMLGEVSNLVITSATVAGMRLVSPQGAAIMNCNIRNNAIGVIADNTQAVTASTFIRTRIFDNTGDGVKIQACDGLNFVGSNIESNGGWGVNLNKQVGAAIAGVSFNNCWFEANATGSITSDSNDISDLNLINNYFNAVGGTLHDYHCELTIGAFRSIGNRFLVPSGSKTITGATQANPVVITTSAAHGYTTGDRIDIASVGGMTEINSRTFTITVASTTTFSLDDEDGTGHTAYTSGGTATSRTVAKVNSASAVYTINDTGEWNMSSVTAKNGFILDQEGDLDCNSGTFSAGSGNTSLAVPTGDVTVTAGDVSMSDGALSVIQSTDADDGDLVASLDINGGGTGTDVVRINCGSDADRTALKFTIAGVISSYLWVDDTGAPRFKTSLPTSDTDGTAM